jgi:hypothetical protein
MSDETPKKIRWRGPSLVTLVRQAKAAGLVVTAAITRSDGRVELQFSTQGEGSGATPALNPWEAAIDRRQT